MSIFTATKTEITLAELRRVERDLQSAIDQADYMRKQIAEYKASLPKEEAKIISLRDEFEAKLKQFKAQP